MRRFDYGPGSGFNTDSLSYKQVRQHPLLVADPDMIMLFSVEAQVCPEPLGLYVRMQDIVLIRTWDGLMDISKKWGQGDYPSNFFICAHNLLSQIMTSIMESSHHAETSFANNCHECNTEVHIETVEFDSKIAFIMTRWMNLGLGLSQVDPMWEQHVSFIYRRPRKFNGDDLERFLMPYSPRACFENTAPQSLEELRSHNLSYIKDQRYKIVMPLLSGSRNLWHVSYKEPSKKGRIGTLWSLVRRSAKIVMGKRDPTFRDHYDPSPPSNRFSWPSSSPVGGQQLQLFHFIY